MSRVVVTGGFDDIRSRDIRFLQEASHLGELDVILWTDEAITRITGKKPKFPLNERQYFLESIRYVSKVSVAQNQVEPDALPYADEIEPELWVVSEAAESYEKRLFCASLGLGYHVIRNVELLGWPLPAEPPIKGAGKVGVNFQTSAKVPQTINLYRFTLYDAQSALDAWGTKP